MAGADGNKDSDVELTAALAEAPYRFGFFEALRQLECMHRTHPRLGCSSRPVDDAVRLGQTPSLQFAPSTLAAYTAESGGVARLLVYFFGLFGPNGPLPLHLTEFARNRLRNAKDPVLADFADLFHHRLLSLFYRAWADKEPTVQLDRPEHDRFSVYVGSLLGLGMPALRRRDAMPDHAKLHFAGHLGCHTRHAAGLASIVSDFFGVPVAIIEFVGEWLAIPDDSYCYLDRSDTTGQLGISAVAGTRSWQCQHKFRIRLGPLGLNDYERMLPGGDCLQPLAAIVRNYTGFELNWDLQLVLRKEEVPAAQLGQFGRLGWTGWIESRHRTRDADDLHLTVERCFSVGGS